MTKKKNKVIKERILETLPYAGVAVAVFALVFVGSLDKKNSGVNLSFDAFGDSGYNVSVDQLSTYYVVADISDTFKLASASDVASNYVTATSLYAAGQTSTGKIEKPNITNIAVSRGVVEYTVADGESMESIAAKYGVSTDEIRWSNGRKTTEVSPGDLLYVPSVSGIVYTVKGGDSLQSIAEKYGSTAEEIVALNDLEISGISEGMHILIKGGTLPETERPEYVPPAPVVRTYTYSYLGDTSERVNMVCHAELGAGQCTTWGWAMRPDLADVLKANANRWDDLARANGILVDNSPSPGAIFQTDSGWYGHVGYVESLNGDGSINVSERNYRGCYGVLYSTIPASAVYKFNYIH